MKIDNVKIKENITFQEQIAAIDYIVSRNFDFDDEGYVIDYRPYFKKIAMVEAISTFFLEGLSFDDNEIIYESIIKNKELTDLIDTFFTKTNTRKALTYEQTIMKFVIDCVEDKLEYMKQLYITQSMNRKDSLSVLLDSISEKFNELNVEEINKRFQSLNNHIVETKNK